MAGSISANLDGGPTWQRRLDRITEGVARRIASVAVAAVLGIAFANVLDIILRNGFGSSLYGLNEINAYLVAIGAACCLPYGLHVGAVLTIRVLDKAASDTAKLAMAVLAAMGTMAFFAAVAWRVWDVASNMARTNQTTIMTNIATAPFIFCMAVALGFAALVMLGKLVDSFIAAQRMGKPEALLAVAGSAVVIAYVLLAFLGYLPTEPFKVLRPSNPLLLALFVFAGMWVIILLSVPIGIAMGLAGIVGTAALLSPSLALEVLGSEITGFVTQDSLSVLPLFLLMGAFASLAGIGSDLYRLAYALVGHIRGGLAHASIIACALFGTLTGSSVATQMSIGRIALGEMRERNYSTELAAGSIAAGGTLGQLIPPSSALILYAILTEESVGQLFIAAVLPGVLATCMYMTAVMVWLLLFPHHAERGPRAATAELIAAAKGAWSVLALLGVVLGGIYFGFFTELEAGSVGAVGAFLIALARGKITPSSFWHTMADTTRTLAMMYSLIFGVTMLTFFFGISSVPQAFVDFVNSFGWPPLGVVVALVVCYLVLGTAMDAFAMMIITIPIFVPLVESLGFDPIWWGIMTIMCVEAGMISPPFGLNIFVISALDRNIPIGTVYKGCWPFFASAVVKIAILIAFPAIVTWLPSTM
ncbi:TRAP transporter large permease [Pseudoprimorskyibacter insulae]|uniref:C4-dicarboxylate TRAP transporter large permease protein DctM n=1 Tax=Pseudoprimorskyibacter insulae TaxID=1695997 RepID=A0A2R8AQC1_9RHOB|nr:TRAP transporter large permease subunit [Pseudoprimorskyibacter insulae]SPF78170.1 C4-dicarboxylate TRAP transporter large permease protein DctM [Pseudoprimorskyibacter insulae]